jgi:hypothetical protein
MPLSSLCPLVSSLSVYPDGTGSGNGTAVARLQVSPPVARAIRGPMATASATRTTATLCRMRTTKGRERTTAAWRIALPIFIH